MALYIGMYGNKMLDLHNLKPSDIDIFDIGWALSQNLRFNGHSRIPYSVASHSLALSYVVPEPLALVALLHDASEAYIGDIVAPVKQEFPALCALEDCVHDVIFEHFGLDVGLMKDVKPYDWEMCCTEARQIMGNPLWSNDQPFGYWSIRGEESAHSVRKRFFARYTHLTGRAVAYPNDDRGRSIYSYREAI